MRNFLTVDLGTTLFKVALFDDAGRLLAIERVAPPAEHPEDQWAVLLQDEVWELLFELMGKLRSRVGDEHWRRIAAVSYGTQANTFSLITQGEASNYISWTDQRAMGLVEELANVSELPGFRRSTGLPRFGPLSSLAKVLWLRRNQPEAFERRDRLCFLNYAFMKELGAENCVEAGEAALTGALDIHLLRWHDDILEKMGVPPLKMPAVHRAGTSLGAVPRHFGFAKGCVAVVGCLDQYAGAIGTGTVEPGRMCETTGTVLAAVRCTGKFADNPPANVFQGPGVDKDQFWQMSFSSTSANLLEWYRNTLQGKPGFDELTELAKAAPPSNLTIEPYEDRGSIQSSFRNVTSQHSPGQVVRAIMQRVAASLRAQVIELSQGQLPTEIRSAGGAARNDFWLQMKADTLGIPFVAMECEEPTSLGAAMLAARAVGLGSLPGLAKQWVRVRKRFEPRRV